jgi:NAD(P)H-hydrate epimerase
MYAADRDTIAAGVPGPRLMEAAGTAVAGEVRLHWSRRPTVVLCGPGNNGGDGFVAARLLTEAGWPVRVALLGPRSGLKGDAALAADDWKGPVEPLAPGVVAGAGIVVDAIFGAGLSRPVDGAARDTLEAAVNQAAPIVAVDVPSGIHGDTGEVMGYAARAARTVSFVRKKPGHLLLPGRTHCGPVHIADIGSPPAVLAALPTRTWENDPGLWQALLPTKDPQDHKYRRGYATVVSGGAATTGAARLAARAALRSGAGLVGVACPPDALAILAASLTSVMTVVVPDARALATFLVDRRRTAVLVGPGTGVDQRTRAMALVALQSGRGCVLDADALTAFETNPETLFEAVRGPTLLTPHEGEFGRLFPDLRTIPGGKLARARAAAKRSGCVVLLKGADTVIAAPDGRAVINGNAPPQLATAGAGDVLAGIALGLMTAGVEPFTAGAAAAWVHGEAARSAPPGLIAEDIIDLINII